MTQSRHKEEKTFLLIKPDGVKRGLIGEIIRRVEQRGLKVVALQMFKATREQIDGHYPQDEAWIRRLGQKTMKTYEKYGLDPEEELGTKDELAIGRQVRSWLVDYMSSAPLVKIVVKGIHAVDMVRKLAGNTMPYLAEMGTIRGDYSVDSPAVANAEKRAVKNLVHASETSQEARHEIDYWMSPEDIFDYERAEDSAAF